MYALAHRLLFTSITPKALGFIQTTCDIHNITAGVFGSFGKFYEPVGRIYYNYFMENWSQVIQAPDFEKFFSELEEDPAQYIHVNKRFRNMVRCHEDSLAKSKK